MHPCVHQLVILPSFFQESEVRHPPLAQVRPTAILLLLSQNHLHQLSSYLDEADGEMTQPEALRATAIWLLPLPELSPTTTIPFGRYGTS